jgi:hypothetical protein
MIAWLFACPALPSPGRAAQAVQRRQHRVADGRPVFDHAGLQLRHRGLQPVMVKRQRCCRVGTGSEGEEGDPVTPPALQKAGQDLLRDRQPVLPRFAASQIFGQHAGRQIECHHQVDPLAVHLDFAFDQLRSGQRHDRQRQQQKAQQRKRSRAACAQRIGQRLDPGTGRHQKGRRCALPAAAQQRPGRQQQQQEEHLGVGEAHQAGPASEPSNRLAAEVSAPSISLASG